GVCAVVIVAYLAHDSEPSLGRSARRLEAFDVAIARHSAHLTRERLRHFHLAARLPAIAREIVSAYRAANLASRLDRKVPVAFAAKPAIADVSASEFGFDNVSGAQ